MGDCPPTNDPPMKSFEYRSGLNINQNDGSIFQIPQISNDTCNFPGINTLIYVYTHIYIHST